MSRRFAGLVAVLMLVGGAALGGVFSHLGEANARFQREAALAGAQAKQLRNSVVLYSQDRVAAGLTFGQTLMRSGTSPLMAASIVGSTQGVFDLRLIRAGHRLEIGRSPAGDLRAIRY